VSRLERFHDDSFPSQLGDVGLFLRKHTYRGTAAAHSVVMLAMAFFALSLSGQKDPNSIADYFTGKEVVLKIDMPGTQQGVDLRYNKDVPMNWKEYSSRLKSNGVAIPKGATARVTGVVVKDDRIEFQLDGGGFGTFLDDSNTTVAAKSVEKSDYEKQLEKQIANTTDDDKKRSLQRDLDRERARRERQDANNRAAAQVASQIKAQQVADNRMRGGSRFNLRWSGSIPADQKTPQAVMKLLADYVSFDNLQTAAAAPAAQNPAGDSAIPATAQLKRGMKIEEVTNLFGAGKQLSESVSNDGLKTQTFQYATGDRRVEVIYVEGLVVRYSISFN
jgi:flagellar motor protein MotB